jgi:uncharacterized membrane protein
MEGFEVLVAMVTVLATVLLFFSLAAYARERTHQLMVVLVVIALFFIKGLTLSIWIFINQPEDMSDILVISLLIDLIILLLLFVSGFKGTKRTDKKQSSKRNTRKTESQ